MAMRLLFLGLFITSTAFGQSQPPTTMRGFLQSTLSPAGVIPYGNNPKAGQYVKAGDATIYYEVYGKGHPVVVLHGGLFGSTYEMGQLIDSLAKTSQVIAVSTRGHGKSELGSAPLTYEQKADDVMAVIKAVTTNSVQVIGFSDGGYAGYKLAGMYPEWIKKLVVIGAGELYPGMRDFRFDPKQAVALDSLYWTQQLALMPQPERLPELFSSIGNFYNQLTVGKELFGKIKCPVLVMAGDRDQTVSVQHLLNTTQLIRTSQLAIIPNSGHTVLQANFLAVWAGIAPFLDQN